MPGNHRRDSPGADSGSSGFLSRWSERKRASREEDGGQRRVAAAGGVASARQTDRATAERPPRVLTDEDMPPLDTLNEASDYSAFLSTGVSEGLHRLALRKLFSSAGFQVRDGLDDYDNDYNLLVPMRKVLASAAREELAQQLQGRSAKAQLAADESSAGEAAPAPQQSALKQEAQSPPPGGSQDVAGDEPAREAPPSDADRRRT